jgi:hypothetical protein
LLEESGKKPTKKPEQEPIKSVGIVTVLLTWLLLNAIWTGALRTDSSVEMMVHEGTPVLFDTVPVPDLFELGRPTRLIIHCDYRAEVAIEPSDIQLIHIDEVGQTELLWSGITDESCPDIEVEWKGGVHQLKTTVERNGREVVPGHDAFTGEMYVEMWVFEPIAKEGYIAFNALAALLFISDRLVRRWIAGRRVSKIRNVSLHEQRRRAEWRELNQSISGGDEVDVDDLLMPETSGGDTEFGIKMRERPWADESIEEPGDKQLLAAEDTTPLDSILDEGDDSTLRGEVKIDSEIRTVADLWRRLMNRK